MIYNWLSQCVPPIEPPRRPQRIVIIRPCCIGDVVLATAALMALRRAFPAAKITWAVGSWSRPAIEGHVLLDSLIDTGPSAMPVRRPDSFIRFVRQLRAGHFDLAVSLVRSPLMSAAVGLSGIPYRAGIDSAGRGFAYNIRVPVDPDEPRHEAEIYLDVVRALGVSANGVSASVPVDPNDQTAMTERLQAFGPAPIVIHPGGGSNPGMTLHHKRWPPDHFAALADRLSGAEGRPVILIGGPDDRAILEATAAAMQQQPAALWAGELSFGEIGALAQLAWVYIGNDTGLTHFAAAAGGRTVMILGPSDPARYRPFTPDSLALWQPVNLRGGVSAGVPDDWDWARDGISVDDAHQRIRAFLRSG